MDDVALEVFRTSCHCLSASADGSLWPLQDKAETRNMAGYDWSKGQNSGTFGGPAADWL